VFLWTALALAPVVLPAVASAQSQAIDGTIEGVVRGAGSEAMANVRVRATNALNGYEREVRTDAGGRYSLPLLPPGSYVVSAEAEGSAPVTQANLDLRAGQVLTIEIEMGRTSYSERAEVSGRAPTVEVGRTVVSNTIEARTVRALPLAGRSIQDFYILQPGVNAGPPDAGSGSSTPTISTVYGGLGLRQMNIDGVSNNLQGGARNLVVSEDSIAEFQTVTNFSAEFGRVAGGLQNAVTRSGSNAVRGSAYLFTRQKFMTSAPFLQAPGTPKPDLERYNIGGTLGAPIVANRAFLFLNCGANAKQNPRHGVDFVSAPCLELRSECEAEPEVGCGLASAPGLELRALDGGRAGALGVQAGRRGAAGHRARPGRHLQRGVPRAHADGQGRLAGVALHARLEPVLLLLRSRIAERLRQRGDEGCGDEVR
jgi:hypothetical protein